jgi:hypothetical protein
MYYYDNLDCRLGRAIRIDIPEMGIALLPDAKIQNAKRADEWFMASVYQYQNKRLISPLF